MDQIINRIKNVAQRRYEEDFVDRLNFQISPLLLVIASSLITFKAYFGGNDALSCWTPQQFHKGWDQYVNDFCLVENTYFVPVDNKSLPNSLKFREDAKLPYYQWVPFILALQGMLFCIPHIFWRSFNWMSGIQLRALVTMTRQLLDYSKYEGPSKNLKLLAKHMYDGLHMGRSSMGAKEMISSPLSCCFEFVTRGTACYITFCYLVMKVLFIANLLIQLAILNFFLDIRESRSLTWGIDLLSRLWRGIEWQQTSIFPRVTVCDFEIRELGNLHRWSVQCVLPLNMFNEKLYVMLWFWFHFTLIVTIINFITWMIDLLSSKRRIRFLEHIVDFLESDERNMVQKLNDELGWDGILILRIIKANTGEFVCVDLVNELTNLLISDLNI